VTKGLNHLHSIEVIHGDLKSVSVQSLLSPSAPAEFEKQSNVLIDPSGGPRLTDFGFSSITRNICSVNASTPNGRGSTRWRAPELLVLSIKPKDQDKAKSARPTNKSDVYSLAMVAIEVTIFSLAQNSVSQPSGHLQIFTGDYPFDSRSDEQVILLLANDERPDRPVHEQFTSRMWPLTKKCWRKDPKKRPDIPEVLEKLESKDGAFSSSHEGR
jgi:serine/threonine protein kinase